MRVPTILSIATSFTSVSATVYQGFNYGNTFTDGSAKSQADFQSEFKTAKNLAGTSGAFTSARLYTMVQGGTASDPIQAIPAAIAEKTSLLLGIWASGGQASVTNEINALSAAIKQYGKDFADLVVGLSVGSEDLYRVSPTGILNKSGVGAGPDEIVNYINQVKKAIAGTPLANVPIGHVDTWNSWTNSSNNPVIEAIDWLGVDEYPFFQNTEANSIDDAYTLFWAAYNATSSAAQGKPVWITETGWPVSGEKQNLAVPNVANAKTFYDQIGCASAFGKVNTWWYILQDAAPTTPNPSFGILGSTPNDAGLTSAKPLFDLSCEGVKLPASLLPTPSASKTASSTMKTAASTPTSSGSSSSGAGGSGDDKSSQQSGSPSVSSPSTPTSSVPPLNSGNAGSKLVVSGMSVASAMLAIAALL
ncbi:glycoside hydrolase superfamily [Xylogone sp. PMI_703]|nr:glycoside hydrolase superfamily [Xylogone sp. PMI_703]